MIFSTRAEYGVRLMVELGRRQAADEPTPLSAVAEAEGLPLAYLERLVAMLRAAELVTSTRGAHGGYRLARPAAEIAMHEVVQALEGPIAPMDCLVDDGVGKVLCSHEADSRACSTRLLWLRVQAGMIEALQRTTLAELVEFSSQHDRTGAPARRTLAGARA